MAAPIFGAVEGDLDEAILRRLVADAGGTVDAVYGKMGKRNLYDRIGGYNEAAKFSPWIVLVDLDGKPDDSCAPDLVRRWTPRRSSGMCLRVAVWEAEAWLLADQARIASFLGTPVRSVPPAPESERDPKRSIVDLARRSHRRDIVADLVPRQASGRSVGPGYTWRLVEFVSDAASGWRPDVAARRSTSLRAARQAIEALVSQARTKKS